MVIVNDYNKIPRYFDTENFLYRFFCKSSRNAMLLELNLQNDSYTNMKNMSIVKHIFVFVCIFLSFFPFQFSNSGY